MSLRDVFRLSPASAAGPALTAVADMLGLVDWNTKLNTLNEKIDAVIAEHNALALERQALALAATEDATAEKELVAVERKHAAVGLTLERLRLAELEAKRHRADEAQAERERLRQDAIKVATEDAERLNKAVAEVQTATDRLEKALAKMREAKIALRISSGEKTLITTNDNNIITSVHDQLSRANGSFKSNAEVGYERGNALRFCSHPDHFAAAAANYFDKQ